LPITVIGEKLNAYAEECRNLLSAKDIDGLVELGREQIRAGAKAIDLHLSSPEVDEKELVRELIVNFQQFGDVPLVFDIQDPEVLEMALRLYPGRGCINSISLEPSREKIIDLAKRYGSIAIALTTGKERLPQNAEERIRNGEEVLSRFGSNDRVDIILDPLVFSVATNPEQIIETLKALSYFNDKGYLTIMGLSNVSFGLPNRSLLNRAFLGMAIANGLDSVILDPTDKNLMELLYADQVLVGRISQIEYIKRFK
ncbi:dihydropteroate synthase, partial [bacterium]|nr:dihydropteroate synthase [bacterium]